MAFNEFKTGELISVKLNKDRKQGCSLTCTYKATDRYGNIHKIVADRIPLPIHKNVIYISEDIDISPYMFTERKIDIGYGMVSMNKDTKVTDEIIEYATKEMTLEEVEKELGYKVKIVSDKEESDEN